MVFDSTDQNKGLLKKYNDVFDGIRDKIKEINSDECDYEKDYMKIKFNSDDDLPLNKPLKFHLMTITVRSVFLKKMVNFIHKSFWMILCMNKTYKKIPAMFFIRKNEWDHWFTLL